MTASATSAVLAGSSKSSVLSTMVDIFRLGPAEAGMLVEAVPRLGEASPTDSAAQRINEARWPCWRGRSPDEKLWDRRAVERPGLGIDRSSRTVVEPEVPASSVSYTVRLCRSPPRGAVASAPVRLRSRSCSAMHATPANHSTVSVNTLKELQLQFPCTYVSDKQGDL